MLKVATLCSLVLFTGCMAATVWLACFENHAHNGVLIGSKEIAASWDGGDLSIGLFEPEPPLHLRFPGQAERFPPLPSFTLSLWPPLVLSLVLPTVWVVQHRRAKRRQGFPIKV